MPPPVGGDVSEDALGFVGRDKGSGSRALGVRPDCRETGIWVASVGREKCEVTTYMDTSTACHTGIHAPPSHC